MKSGTSIIERALELARCGSCRTVGEIRQRLRREGYAAIESHTAGAVISKQLRDALAARSR